VKASQGGCRRQLQAAETVMLVATAPQSHPWDQHPSTGGVCFSEMYEDAGMSQSKRGNLNTIDPDLCDVIFL